MKILSIRLKNLASLAGEHFIDFESDPLASAGLIAIVGKTGAGKSTILDAMCLALFNRVPRLKDSDGKLVDVDGSELLTNSPLTVLRRGTSHGFAELSFIAQDQKVYLARWEIKRARENPNGKLQSVQRSLKCLTDGNVVADKAKAVETQIHQITQLTFEQFTRAVLLAQSEVTAFLKARDNERGELLQYLTNSDIFEKIGQLAYEKTKQIANQRKELENVLGHIEILSDEIVTEFSGKLQQAHDQYKILEQEKTTLEKQQQWFEQRKKFENDVQQRQQQLTTQQKLFDQLAFKRNQFKQLEVFASIRPCVIQQKKVEIDINHLKPQIQSSEQQFNIIKNVFDTEKSQFQMVDTQLKAQQNFEQTHQQQLEQVRTRIQERDFILQQFNKAKSDLLELEQKQKPIIQDQTQLKNEIDQLKLQQQAQTQQLQQTDQFNSLDQGLTTHLNQLQRFIQTYKNFEYQCGDFTSASTTLEAKQQQLSSSQQQFGQDEIISQHAHLNHQNREKNLQNIHQLGLVQNQFQQYIQIHIEKEKAQKNQLELLQNTEQSKQNSKSAEQEYQTQKQEREQLQRLLEKQRLLHSDNIEKLREQLVKDEACLVCGSTHHPYIKDQSTLSAELFNLQEQQEQQAIQLEKTCFENWQNAQQIYTKQMTSLESNTARFTELSTIFQQTEQQLKLTTHNADIHLDLTQSNEVIKQNLAQKIEQLQQQNTVIEKTLTDLSEAQKQQRELTQFIQRTTQQLSVVHQAEQNIQHIIELLTSEQQQNWKAQTLVTAEHIQHQLHTRLQLLQHYEALNYQLNSKTQNLSQLEQRIQFCHEQIQSAEIQKAEYAQKGKDNTDLAVQLILEMTQNKVEKPHEWLIQFDQQRQQLQKQFNEVRESYDNARQSFEHQQRQLDHLKTQLAQLEVNQRTSTLEVQQWLNHHVDFNIDLIEQLQLISPEQEQQIRLTVQQVEHALMDAQSAFKAIQEQYQQHLEHQPEIEFDQLLIQLNSLLETLQHTQEVRDSFRLKLEVHQRNLDKQKQFAEQIQQIQTEEHRWNKISSLMGDATGKKFRDYAQQYNLDILIEYANQQLAMLSQRYTLKRLDNSLSLAIVDHDMDGETRSVSSLSGGESFLTALALSLAIANMASGSMKIESLFIDEGFGTLDASSLHMVMNALDQLQSQGRKVVLISHIQEMHERIPVQIQVNPIGAGASTIQVVG